MSRDTSIGSKTTGTTDGAQTETIEIEKENFVRLFDSFNLLAEIIVEIREDGVPLPEKDDEDLSEIEAQVDYYLKNESFMGGDAHKEIIQQYKEWRGEQ